MRGQRSDLALASPGPSSVCPSCIGSTAFLVKCMRVGAVPDKGSCNLFLVEGDPHCPNVFASDLVSCRDNGALETGHGEMK